MNAKFSLFQDAVERLIGMFAFAAWDRTNHMLTLGRDRLGIKPLYWGHAEGRVVFASELKTLKTVPGWRGETDHGALSEFLRYGYVPAPMTIFRSQSIGTSWSTRCWIERLCCRRSLTCLWA